MWGGAGCGMVLSPPPRAHHELGCNELQQVLLNVHCKCGWGSSRQQATGWARCMRHQVPQPAGGACSPLPRSPPSPLLTPQPVVLNQAAVEVELLCKAVHHLQGSREGSWWVAEAFARRRQPCVQLHPVDGPTNAAHLTAHRTVVQHPPGRSSRTQSAPGAARCPAPPSGAGG